MHLPPLDVAIYPVVTMSRGSHSKRLVRPSSTASSTSSSSTESSQSCSASPDFLSIQKIIRAVFRTSKITVQHAERLQGWLHQVYLARLADGNCLVLKCPPSHNTRVLRHEKHFLESERTTLETLHEYTQLPVPQVIKHDHQGGALGSPYLMMTYLPGRRLSEIARRLTPTERHSIDRTLGTYVGALTALSATQFGMTRRVFAKKGCSTWKEAFLSLLESVLRDGEDMLVTIPYESVRYYIGKCSHFLDQATQPRLVALNVCDPQNVLIDEQTKRVTGLVGFSNVIWGDPLMCGGIANGSDAFFAGLGERLAETEGIQARLHMYTAYRAIVDIVAHHCRSHQGTYDMDARRSLSHALNELAKM
ncbi:kinase-like domain-containing protein [Phaeosphaeria sp. MPI-PUGE-AT-0046c]|nr:kinase-like domain-containing protein [Phaeosphaeria sp. MPI-PUGE-AT-0046c]